MRHVERRPQLVKNRKQLAALTSSIRQEIVDALSQMGTVSVSVSELAAALGRPPDALYYHLRALKKAGLVLHAGFQGEGVRKEELIQCVSSDLKLHYEPGKGGNTREITSIVGSMLRLGIRDFRRAFQSQGVAVSGPGRELWALRRTGWLTSDEILSVNRAIEGLARSISKPPGKGRLYGITVLLTPLDHRGRKRKKETGRRKGKSE
jgi:DNA-binding transcriptional ArsR family regulator